MEFLHLFRGKLVAAIIASRSLRARKCQSLGHGEPWIVGGGCGVVAVHVSIFASRCDSFGSEWVPEMAVARLVAKEERDREAALSKCPVQGRDDQKPPVP